MHPQPPQQPVNFARATLWGAYLGSSWTWCIGMFLPLLLMRDFGLLSFVVFAVPNVLGAAAMGWVLRDGASEALTTAHAGMVRAFSLVTIAFQTFFLTWMLSWLGTTTLVLAAASGVLALASVLTGVGRDRSDTSEGVGGLFQWCASAAVLIVWLVSGELTGPPSGLPPASGELAPLAMVCVLGFLLCPYLDATFHHARRRCCSAESRWAFGLGFGVFFLAMILGTLAYSGAVLGVLGGAKIGRVLLWVLGLHIGLQLLYTSKVHAQRWPRHRAATLGAAALGVVIGLLSVQTRASVGVLSMPEATYRLLMAFYGLVFPAYVWVCMLPQRRGAIVPPRRTALAACAGAVLLAAPCYWMGFIARESWWLSLGVAIVLLARLVGRTTSRAAA